MSVAEAESYVEGMRKRPRDMMEATRAICQVVHKVLTGKELPIDFDWDSEARDWDDDEIEEAMADARMMEEYMKQVMNYDKG